MSEEVVKIYLKDIVGECMLLNEEVHKLTKEIFKDKSEVETLAGLLMLSTVFVKSVEKRIGVDATNQLQEYILKYMS